VTRANAPEPSWDVVTLGETMGLFRSETVGPLAHTRAAALGIGGAESNVAIGLRRLGRSVAWVGRVGDDSLGELVVRELRAEGVDIFETVDPGAPTGLMIKERRTATTQQVWYYRDHSAGSRLSHGDVPVEVVQRARVLHITGITPALSASAADAVDCAIEQARAAGALISLDINYRARLWRSSDAGPVMRRLASLADIVFAGEDEAALVLGHDGPRLAQARAIAELGPTQVIVKCGADGCVALLDDEELTQPALPVGVVDSVGAGDAFVAGYLAELTARASPAERLWTAVRTGAFVCTTPGDWEGAARREDLKLLEATETVTR
jgi:2-dehydro-3-deoxygluconokinase